MIVLQLYPVMARVAGVDVEDEAAAIGAAGIGGCVVLTGPGHRAEAVVVVGVDFGDMRDHVGGPVERLLVEDSRGRVCRRFENRRRRGGERGDVVR